MALESRTRAQPPPMIQLHLPLLQDFYKHFASKNLLRQSRLQSLPATKGQPLRPVKATRTAVSSCGLDSRQPTLVLTPSVELTRRYYANKSSSHDRQQLKKLVDGLETQACSRCPFSQVVYPNLVDTRQPAAAEAPEGQLSYLPRPGGMTLSTRSPTFVHRQKVRQSRSSLERALTSGNSQADVVQRAITHLRDAIVMPIASDRSRQN